MPGEFPAARVTDRTAHLNVPAAPGVGSATVLIGGLPAWRTLGDTHACTVPTPTPHGPERVLLGSTTVLINNQMACRMGDILQDLGPPSMVMMGEQSVIIGDVGFGMGKADVKGRFAAAMVQMLDDWSELKTKDRLDRVQLATSQSEADWAAKISP